MTPQERREMNRRIATEFLEKIKEDTFCAHCGEQPVEWHDPEHVYKANSRVSSLRTQGLSIRRIQQEISRCTPLCRSCHMKEDGRMSTLRQNQPRQKGITYVPPLPCSCCGHIVKRLRNNLCSTCDNHRSGRRLRKTVSCDGCCRTPLQAIEDDLDDMRKP